MGRTVRAWRRRVRPSPPTAAASAAGPRASGRAAAGSARPGAPSSRSGRRGCGRCPPVRSPRRPYRSGRCRPSRTAAVAPASPSSTGSSAAGWCPGAVVLLAGEPGVGKSTLLLEVAAQLGRGRATRPVRHGRGVRRPGAAPRRAHRRARRRAVPRCRDRPVAPCSGTSRRSTRACSWSTRCRPRVGRGRRRARRGDPGARGHRRPDPGGEGSAACRAPRRARDQGRRRSPARAPLEHLVDVVLHVRGRPALPAAAGPRASRTASGRPTRSAAST